VHSFVATGMSYLFSLESFSVVLESIFWAEFLCTLQDQKAHEAILKVLNLDRVERFVSNI